MMVRSTRSRGSRRTRYLECPVCKNRDKEIVQIDDLGRPVVVVVTSNNQPDFFSHDQA